MTETKKNLLANFLGAGWNALMGFAFLPLYIRYLGAEAYGLVGVYLTLLALFALLDMGMGPTVQREMARFLAGAHSPRSIHTLFRTLESLYLLLTVAIGATLTLAAEPLARGWFRFDTLAPEAVAAALTVIGWTIAARWLTVFYRNAIIGLQRQVWLNLAASTFTTVRSVGVIPILAWHSPTIGAFFLFQGAVMAIEAALYAAALRRQLPPAGAVPWFSMAALQPIWRFSAGLLLTTLFTVLLTQIDKIVLSRLIPLEQFGYYTLATTVAGALGLLATPIGNATYPRMASLTAAGDLAGLADFFHKVAGLVAVLILPLGLTLALFPREILLLWSGDPGLAAAVAPLLSLYALGSTLNALVHPPWHLQLAFGWTRLAIYANALATLISLPLLLRLVPEHGATAAAALWTALNLAYLTIVAPLVYARLLPGHTLRWYLHDLLKPGLAALAVLAAVRWWLPQPAAGERLLPALEIALAAAVATAAAALAVRPELRRRLLDTFHRPAEA